MEQHPVPRNISSFQFHLVGDMTMRQFLYLAGGALIAFLIFKLLPLPGLLKYLLVGIAALSGFAFAFLPIQDRPLDKWLLAFFKSINSPTQFLWQKEVIVPDVLARTAVFPIKTLPQNHQVAHQDAKRKLETYLSSLPEQPHQTLNIREKHYVDRTLQLFNTSDSYGVVVRTEQPGYQAAAAFIPSKPTSVTPSGPTIRVNVATPAKQKPIEPEIVKLQQSATQAVKSQIEPEKTPIDSEPVSYVQTKPQPQAKVISQQQVRQAVGQVVPASQPAPSQPPKKEEMIVPKKQVVTEPVEQPVRPDAIEVKAAPSEKPAGQTLVSEKQQAVEVSKPAEEKRDHGEEMIKIMAEKEKLEQELKKLKEELYKSKRLDFGKATTSKPDIVKPQLEQELTKPTIKAMTAKTAVNEMGIPRLPQIPNIIMGVIKDPQNKLLPNIILTIKDTKGVPHRALKTNRLGQFSTATPLQNGTYHIEAEDPLKRYVFDIAEIILSGKLFLPIEITAKGEKELIRDKLTKEIFGNQAI